MQPLSIAPRRSHFARLFSIWRSAGWPCHDALELDLIAAGWVERLCDDCGRETLSLTDAGIGLLAQQRQRRSRSASAHERLALRVSAQLAREGRIVWRELALRAQLEAAHAAQPHAAQAEQLALSEDLGAPSNAPRGSWRMARPDVFSIRNTSVERYLFPMVHEIKTSRADLLADLRAPAKRACYRWLSCETYYVFPAEIAAAEEVPQDYGVWLLHGAVDSGALELHRPAPHMPCALPFAVWLALARAAPEWAQEEPAQDPLSAAPALPQRRL